MYKISWCLHWFTFVMEISRSNYVILNKKQSWNIIQDSLLCWYQYTVNLYYALIYPFLINGVIVSGATAIQQFSALSLFYRKELFALWHLQASVNTYSKSYCKSYWKKIEYNQAGWFDIISYCNFCVQIQHLLITSFCFWCIFLQSKWDLSLQIYAICS